MTWTPTVIRQRDGVEVPAESATLTVPEWRGDPDSPTITLRMVRLPARQPSGPPTVFLSGGPGDSAIQWASHPPFFAAFDRVRERTDVILLDQRGAGTSERDLRLPDPGRWPVTTFADGDRLRNAVIQHAVRGSVAFRAQGVALEGYTVEESADDLRDLADALEVDRLNLWGYSYGTHLAQATARRWPDRVQRVALCGFEGPDQTFKLPSQLEAQLDRLDRWAADQGFEAFKARLAAQLARLDDAPVTVEWSSGETVCAGQVGGAVVRQVVAAWSSVSNRIPWLPRLVASLEADRTERLAEAMGQWWKGLRRPLTFYWTDGASGATPERWARIRAEAGTTVLGDAVNEPFPAIALALGVRDLGEGFRSPVVSRLPFLILTGGFDGFTPTANARESLGTLSQARLTEVPGAAHNDLLLCEGAVLSLASFLGEGRDERVEVAALSAPRMATLDAF